MILRSRTEDENRHSLALTVILNVVKDLLYVFDALETDNKQILRRGVYMSMAEGLLRITLRQVRATGGKPTTPIFE
jgi:hypothetical protein